MPKIPSVVFVLCYSFMVYFYTTDRLIAYYRSHVDEQSKNGIKDILIQYDCTLLVADLARRSQMLRVQDVWRSRSPHQIPKILPLNMSLFCTGITYVIFFWKLWWLSFCCELSKTSSWEKVILGWIILVPVSTWVDTV